MISAAVPQRNASDGREQFKPRERLLKHFDALGPRHVDDGVAGDALERSQ
jgi:hypothetical protein